MLDNSEVKGTWSKFLTKYSNISISLKSLCAVRNFYKNIKVVMSFFFLLDNSLKNHWAYSYSFCQKQFWLIWWIHLILINLPTADWSGKKLSDCKMDFSELLAKKNGNHHQKKKNSLRCKVIFFRHFLQNSLIFDSN